MSQRSTQRSAMRTCLGMLLMVCAHDAWSVNVRGRVDFGFASGTSPMARAEVRLCDTRQQCRSYVTGQDGMYYFNADAGDYIVMVNGIERLRLRIPARDGFDIEPLVIR